MPQRKQMSRLHRILRSDSAATAWLASAAPLALLLTPRSAAAEARNHYLSRIARKVLLRRIDMLGLGGDESESGDCNVLRS
jgi:hypothetical protein